MSKELKIIFDECLSEPVVDSLRPFLERSGVTLKLKGVVSFQKAGTPDSVWIPQIAAEPGWIVISSDRAKSKSERLDQNLPHLCREHRVTHILLSSTVHNLKLFDKARAIVAVWNDLLKASEVKAGTRFLLKKHHRDDTFILVNTDLKMPTKKTRGGNADSAAQSSGETTTAQE